MTEKLTCRAAVWAIDNYELTACGEPAKWIVGKNRQPLCGIHGRADNWRVRGKERIKIENPPCPDTPRPEIVEPERTGEAVFDRKP